VFHVILFQARKPARLPRFRGFVTPLTPQRKRARIADKKKRIAKAKSEAAEYQKLLATRLKAQRDRRSESLARRDPSYPLPPLNPPLLLLKTPVIR